MVWGWIVRRIEEEQGEGWVGAGEVSGVDRRREEREGAVGAGMECGVTAAGSEGAGGVGRGQGSDGYGERLQGDHLVDWMGAVEGKGIGNVWLFFGENEG
eukprot:218999-Rhodomonas_salina.3